MLLIYIYIYIYYIYIIESIDALIELFNYFYLYTGLLIPFKEKSVPREIN